MTAWPSERAIQLLVEPDIAHEVFVSVLNTFELCNATAIFVSSGDTNSAVYRITAAGAQYLLKLRCGDFDEIAATVPAWLHANGISRVMSPISVAGGQPWLRAHGFDWMLYPFFDGRNGFESPLSRAHWIALGDTMRQVHAAILPPEIAQRVPQESFSPRYRTIVKELDQEISVRRRIDNPSAAQLAALWTLHRADIRAVLERAEQLAETIRRRDCAFVLCHSDLHAGNVLISSDDQLTIVDWDNPIFAPRERDLMFIGGGVGGAWNRPRESEWFFTGYDPAEIDPSAIAFYRYERVLVDIAEYGLRILDLGNSARDRQVSVAKLATAFLPGNVIEMAHKSFSILS